MPRLEPGLYELLLTRRLELAISDIEQRLVVHQEALHPAEAPDRLALHLAGVIEKVLAALPTEKRVHAGAALVGELIKQSVHEHCSELADEALSPGGAVLTEISDRAPDGSVRRHHAPVVPLLDTALMTNAPGEPRLGHQIASEIPSAQRIDIIMAFIRRSGVGPLRDALRRHASSQGKPLRVLTTTYTGSTEVAALEELQQLGAQVRVSYDTSTTRLHAKAWLFHRPHSVSTGYIGSSNLTHSAQVSGLEWNLRVSSARNRTVLERMDSLFESCWNSGDFVPFDAETFRAAIKEQRPESRVSVLLPGIELRLEPFQERLLELIALERQRGRHRNLLVSATGTGKTVMAAVDYARLRERLPRARLLFIAHRKEILEQSQGMFRYAMRDPSFGELWVDGKRPEQFEHVFASVQSLTHIDLTNLPADHFDVVIVDEFHHASAPTYQDILYHLEPRELLGLTATPERGDGQSVTHWFEHRIAAELRLWDAIDQQRLVPFAYYGVPDNTQLSGLKWKRGQGYDVAQLTQVLTADHAWVNLVIQALVEKVSDVRCMRALGFCVSVGHARFMAQAFNERGIKAAAVTGESDSEVREDALLHLAAGQLQVVFSVDLFNEGVDVPAVDTLLMLRPTESPTLFLQQLGRGLRRHTGKALCTVIDFVGQHHQKFSYAARFRALLGGTRRQLMEQVEQGFPFLPSGCHLVLEGVARDRVLSSIRNAVPRGLSQMADTVRQMRQEAVPVTLASFLEHSGLDLEDVYGDGSHGRCWSDVLQAAGEPLQGAGPHEGALRKACTRLLHVDDAPRLEAYRRWLTNDVVPDLTLMSKSQIRWLRMLMGGLSTSLNEIQNGSLAQGLQLIWQHPQVRAELVELFDLLLQRTGHLGHSLSERPNVPLQVHARYSRVEIQAAFGDSRAGEDEMSRLAVPTWREGVKWMGQERCDVFLITLNKTEKRFSPTTRYRDYAISRELLHWESQSGTRGESPTGRRYQKHVALGTGVMIFARLNADDRAFHFLGSATYQRHEGDMPMRVTWELSTPLPGDLLISYRAAVA